MRLNLFSPASHEELVLERHPHAEPVLYEPIHHHGDDLPYCPAEWAILCETEELGRGLTEVEAWENAARRIAGTSQEAA
jgi:hypothetical protein